MTLTAKVLPETADNKDVTWSVEGEAADISQEGVLTVKSEGVVTVKATAKDGSGVCGTMTVTVKKEQENQTNGATATCHRTTAASYRAEAAGYRTTAA